MNAKEQIIQILKFMHDTETLHDDEYQSLITAVENAIFDVPSEEELIKESPTIDTYDEFIQYLRNYKKP